MGQQEILTEGSVGTKAALEGLVADVGQLMVQQCLLVVTDKLAELTFEPGGSLQGAQKQDGEPRLLPNPGSSGEHTCGWLQPGCV